MLIFYDKDNVRFISNYFQNLLVFEGAIVLYFGLRVGEADTKFGDLEPS